MRVAITLASTLLACGRVHFDPRGDGAHDDAPEGVPRDAPTVIGCAALPPTCGPMGTRDCCDTLPVPGGTFLRRHDVGTDGMFSNNTSWPATVNAFWLDKYEVTVGRFRRFVMAGQGTQVNAPAANAGARTLNGMPDQGGWQPAWNANLPADAAAQLAALNCDAQDQTWTDTPGANESLPINCISWFDALAFCIWDGGWLPTEAEWNYAASGGDEHRAYPWSIPSGSLTIDCAHANYYDATSMSHCTDPANGAANRVGSESPVGDARWGHADLSGNLWEWTLDWSTASPPTPCTDCAELTPGSVRVTRGGYFKNDVNNLRAGNSGSDSPEMRVQHVGVRCARGS